MTRRQERENVFIIAFEESFKCNTFDDIIASANEEERNIESYGISLLKYYQEALGAIDEEIQSKLKGWSTVRISRTSLIILRIAVTEMLYCKDEEIPISVSINEAVELAKKYADEEEYQFINGVLGAIAKESDMK